MELIGLTPNLQKFTGSGRKQEFFLEHFYVLLLLTVFYCQVAQHNTATLLLYIGIGSAQVERTAIPTSPEIVFHDLNYNVHEPHF